MNAESGGETNGTRSVTDDEPAETTNDERTGTTNDERTGTTGGYVDEPMVTRTTTVSETTDVDGEGRWVVGIVLALVAGSAGVVLSNTGAFLAGIVGLVYAGYVSLSGPPTAPLVVERTVAPAAPKPGDRVSVTVRAENVGSVPLADLRVADDPPDGLEVVDGETRRAATVEPGDAVEFEYDLRIPRGKHAFGDVVAVARGASGVGVRRTVYDAAATLVCHAPVESLALAGQTGIGAGRVQTDSGGEGVEFYATREYARGDPASRVDWNRYASTGELTTVTYRESNAATVVFVVDGRFDHRRALGEPTARELCCYATVRIADAVLDDQNLVGASVCSYRSSNAIGTFGTVGPDRGTEQSLRIRALLREKLGVDVDDLHVAADRDSGSGSEEAATERSDATPDGSGSVARQDRRLLDDVPGGAQVVFVTPLLDDAAVRTVDELVAHEHVTTVVSPDVTDGSTPGGAVERVMRSERLRAITATRRVRVVDWSPDEPLQAAVDRAGARWDG
ncbi:NEW3 domain-containing protein [Halosimplex amylolyticum]|uniref:NEW3 domain-containing protein n=1 Tax=Halosimplex amylolyticum TaxID=3396616 RepID=UPI003F57CAF9